MTEDQGKYAAEQNEQSTMDMTVGFSDTEFIKIDALRSDLKLSWKELLDKIVMAFSDTSLKGNDVDKINFLKQELNLPGTELVKKVCLIELTTTIKKE